MPQDTKRERPLTDLAYAAFLFGLFLYFAPHAAQLIGTPHDLGGKVFLGFTALLGLIFLSRLTALFWRLRAHWKVMRPKGERGRAAWGDYESARKSGLLKRRLGKRKGAGFFAGLLGRLPVFVDVESSGLILSPAGGGKTVGFVIPALLHNRMSMVVADLKATLAPVTGAARKRYFKHRIYCLNPARQHEAVLGAPAAYNPLIVLIEDWEDENRHLLLMSDAQEVAKQLIQEPREAGENVFFRNGSRKLLVFAFLYLLIETGELTLARALRLLSDVTELETALYMARASDMLSGDLSRLAADILSKMDTGDTRQFESFREGALQALEPFSPSGVLADSTSRCDFRFSELRTNKAAVYVMPDPTQMEAFAPWIGLVMWAAKTELVRCQTGQRVCFMLDEVTNFKIAGLPALLTSLREFKIVLWLVVQELEQWGHVYGQEAVETLLSQTPVKILHGSRSFKTCKLISDMLGERSIRSTSYNTGRHNLAPITRQVSESAQKLMTPDEVARFEKVILLNGPDKPLILERAGYQEVEPWRSRAGINPLFGKRFKGRVKARV